MLRISINLVVMLSLLLISVCATLTKDFERPESHACSETDGNRDERLVRSEY